MGVRRRLPLKRREPDWNSGDTITLQALGREIDARIAALRKGDGGRLGSNFLIVLDAQAVQGANL